ncbi:MAG: DUF1508 domain-containing protein [Chloroflexi bacterium]|nr:DUF1508 domain-containing protein [Chloroflexota bacterium]
MKYEVDRNSKNEWYWRLRASNGKIIARSSEGYINRSDCLHSIKLVKSAYNAPVVG